MHKRITESDLILDEYGIKRLPELDGGLTFLDLSGCTSLTSLPENLPAGLTSLNLNGCTSLISLPEKLPAGLTSLYLNGCTSLTSLPENLPARIISLFLSGCTSLTSLTENLPAGIKHLFLNGCTSLTSLPEKLPDGLTFLNLSGCASLIFTPELTERLLTLEASGAHIRYPDHFLSNAGTAAVAKLESAINSYAETNPDLPKPERIKNLLNRFVNEGIKQRGGNKEIVATTSAILTAFTQDPNHLKWANEIAADYLEGCVNQPVAGWSEICALMAIAQAPKEKKLEASKQYRVFKGVLEYLNELPADQQLNSFEAEAANSLFKEVHKKLLNEGEIDQAWQGVPKLIRYADYVDGFLHANNNKVINDFHSQAKEILAQTPEEVAKYFCHEFRIRTWASVVFPEEVAEIEKLYNERKYSIEEVIDKKNTNGKQEQEDDDELKGKTVSELREEQANLEIKKEVEIYEKVKESTNALVVGIQARPSSEVEDVTICSSLTQMMQGLQDFFSRR